MQVHDHKDGHIEFLHVLNKGPAGKSYGVKVAELAGLPKEITSRAEILLKSYENSSKNSSGSENIPIDIKSNDKTKKSKSHQMNFFEVQPTLTLEQEQLLNELKQLSISQTSPLQALNKLAEWQEKLN